MPIRVVVRGLLDLVAPPRCVACDEELEPGEEGFCLVCSPLLEPLAGAEASMAVLRFGGPLASAMRRFKYGGRSELARPLARAIAERARAACAGMHAIVPVPLHTQRLRERGFDQTSLLARELAKILGVPRRLDLLERTRPTTVQAALDRAARLANVEGAFVGSPRAKGLRLLVLDDVRTTGATLSHACHALLRVGAARAQPLALALADVGEDSGSRGR
jgi:ComF family protein